MISRTNYDIILSSYATNKSAIQHISALKFGKVCLKRYFRLAAASLPVVCPWSVVLSGTILKLRLNILKIIYAVHLKIVNLHRYFIGLTMIIRTRIFGLSFVNVNALCMRRCRIGCTDMRYFKSIYVHWIFSVVSFSRWDLGA